ncbi:MAG: hypothetical protein ABEJ79_12100 [Halolamina sp.]
MTTDTADRVVLSYPEALSEWGRDQVEADRYRGFLRRMLGEVAVGDTVEEFVDVGCCGDSLDVTFRVEAVAGGGVVGEGTTVAYETRTADHEGGWRVQSAAGPGACEVDEAE